jgi:hypothetical protein
VRTCLTPLFPVFREKTGKIREISDENSIIARVPADDSMACRQIPYANEQGILGGITANLLDLGPIF